MDDNMHVSIDCRLAMIELVIAMKEGRKMMLEKHDKMLAEVTKDLNSEYRTQEEKDKLWKLRGLLMTARLEIVSLPEPDIGEV